MKLVPVTLPTVKVTEDMFFRTSGPVIVHVPFVAVVQLPGALAPLLHAPETNAPPTLPWSDRIVTVTTGCHVFPLFKLLPTKLYTYIDPGTTVAVGVGEGGIDVAVGIGVAVAGIDVGVGEGGKEVAVGDGGKAVGLGVGLGPGVGVAGELQSLSLNEPTLVCQGALPVCA